MDSPFTAPRKPRSSWQERMDDLAQVISETGAVPRRRDHPELTAWLYGQYSRLAAGKLSPEKAAAFTALIDGFTPRRMSRDRISELEAFWAANARLPRRSTTDPEENSLSTFLVMDLRSRIRRNRITPEDLARLQNIPGAVNIRSVPDQEKMLEDLRAYVARHHLMPGPDGTEETRKLTRWVTNNTRGNPDTKSAALRARHLAIEDLRASTVPRYTSRALERLAAAERFCTVHGHRPGTASDLPESERLLADWLNRRIAAGTNDDITARRLTALAAFPSRRDAGWLEHLQALEAFLAETGSLPSAWEQEHFSWLTVQRRDYRAGILPEWKVAELSRVPGIISGRKHAA